ncbi:hypothetical protein HDV00_011900 [Rhizophlyctis rosea]|nr:hypothetical protein HDV00_011900 [Rhizophlyctis rosea]
MHEAVKTLRHGTLIGKAGRTIEEMVMNNEKTEERGNVVEEEMDFTRDYRVIFPVSWSLQDPTAQWAEVLPHQPYWEQQRPLEHFLLLLLGPHLSVEEVEPPDEEEPPPEEEDPPPLEEEPPPEEEPR